MWERGRGRLPVQRALELLSAACPGESREALGLRSIRDRDAALFELREATLGSEICGIVDCPVCGDKLEFSFTASDLLGRYGPESPAEFELDLGEYQLRLRTPNSADLLAAAENGLEEARQGFFHRCLISAHRNGQAVGEFPAEMVQAAGEKMAEIDPAANVHLAVSCASCGHRRAVAFDIGSFFWTEIEACAVRLLNEVHELASGYGWTERDILTLSALRRQFYVEAMRS